MARSKLKMIRREVCMASPWPPVWLATPRKIFGSTRLAGWSAPTRSEGGTRLYSEDDLARLREISELLEERPQSGRRIHMVLGLQEENERLQRELDKRSSEGEERSEVRHA